MMRNTFSWHVGRQSPLLAKSISTQGKRMERERASWLFSVHFIISPSHRHFYIEWSMFQWFLVISLDLVWRWNCRTPARNSDHVFQWKHWSCLCLLVPVAWAYQSATACCSVHCIMVAYLYLSARWWCIHSCVLLLLSRIVGDFN